MPESSPIRSFLTAVFPEVSPSWLLLWGAPSKHSEFVQTVTDETIAMVEAWAQRENVYVGCGLRSQNFGPTMRGSLGDIVSIPGVWLDIDYGTEHKKPNLPPNQEAAKDLVLSLGPEPTVLVHSGRGLQAWWLFEEAWTLESEAERAQAEALTKGWNNTLRAKAHAKGWDADQVGDLPRVMRLPGTWNRKSVPRRVELLDLNLDRRYQPSDFDQYLIADAHAPKEAMPDMSWEFTLSPQAEPPADRFMLLCEADTIFRKSWLHARPDMPDQSASSYDMSLATRALLAGWTGQETVNTLIAHRRKYKEDLKLREDYYRRTLNRAARDKVIDERQRIVEEIKEGKDIPDEIAHDKGDLLAIINSLWFSRGDHKLSKIVKYLGEPNRYEIELDGRTIKVGTIDMFTSQTKFRNLLADMANIFPDPQKAETWNRSVQRLLNIVETVDPGPEAFDRGAVEGWLQMYLSDGLAATENAEKAMLDGMPFLHNGKPHITLEGFHRFVMGRCHERISTKELAVHLRKLGAQADRIDYRPAKQKHKVKTQRVWGLPQ